MDTCNTHAVCVYATDNLFDMVMNSLKILFDIANINVVVVGVLLIVEVVAFIVVVVFLYK